MTELYQERLRENHEVIADIGRYNHGDVDDDWQRLSNEKTLVSKQGVERSQDWTSSPAWSLIIQGLHSSLFHPTGLKIDIQMI